MERLDAFRTAASKLCTWQQGLGGGGGGVSLVESM